MVFSDVTNLNGIVQTIERLTDVGQGYFSGDSDRLKEITAIVNRVNGRVWHTIFKTSGNWQYDDSDYSDMPFSTADLVSGQRKYLLPSDALTVKRVEVKNDSVWTRLKPITAKQLNGAIDEFSKGDGVPSMYRLFDDVIELFPASNYNGTQSLKVYFDRGSVSFSSTDTTATPGFASPYHEILPIKASIEWLKIKQPSSPTLTLLLQDEMRIDRAITEFYASRFKDLPARIHRVKQNYV